MSNHRRPAPESATVFINDEETRAATGTAMTIGKPEAPVIVFSTIGGAFIATRVLKRGHTKHQRQRNIDWWRYYVTLFTRTNRIHYQKTRITRFLRR